MSGPELPNLKKREKERKKAGAVWHGWGSGASPFSGATGGTGATVVRASASAAAQAAMRGGQGAMSRSAAAALLAQLMSSNGGRVALAGMAAAVLGGVMMLYSMFFGSAPAGRPAFLGAPESSIRVYREGGSAALSALASAAKGQLKFEPDKPPEKPPEAVKSEPPIEKPSPMDWTNVLRSPDQTADRMAHNLSGAKLSESLGGAFGGKNVFANGESPKFGAGFDRSRLKPLSATRGAIKRMKGGVGKRGAPGGNPLRGRSKRAIGQLKLARMLSRGANAVPTNEGQKTMAAAAFDGQASQGGEAPASPIASAPAGSTGGAGTTVPPMGTGAPDVTTPPDAGHANATPYQEDLNKAFDTAAQAGQLKKTSILLMILGLALIAIGAAMLPMPAGAVLMALGGVLVGISIMMLMMAQMMAAQARQMADLIQRQYGQLNQNKIVQECVDQAIANGTSPDECRPETTAPDMSTDIKEAVTTERNSSSTLGGKPIEDPIADPKPPRAPSTRPRPALR